jgi:DnaK suppressor protein
MKPEIVTKFKALFEEQRRSLIYSQSVVNEQFHMTKDDMLDETDMTSTETEQSMRMRLRNREALFLKKIDEALDRIAQGTFGECQSCNEDIEFRRLEARPTATLCVGCKEDQEKTEHLHIDGHKPKSLGAKLRLA